jgi:hypothetical protein
VFKALLYRAIAIQLNGTSTVGTYGEAIVISLTTAVNDVFEYVFTTITYGPVADVNTVNVITGGILNALGNIIVITPELLAAVPKPDCMGLGT